MWLIKKTKFDQISKYIWELVYGGIDGIVTTFAVVAWFVWAGATNTLGEIWPLAVVLFWLANLFGDGVSMWLGKFLSTKSEQDIYCRDYKTQHDMILSNPDLMITRTLDILQEEGMSVSDASWYVKILQQYPDIWTEWFMDYDLKINDVRDDNPILQWLMTLISFIIFWFIPLIPFIFAIHVDGRVMSVIMTLIALFILWLTRWFITRSNFAWTVWQIVILGAVAAIVAYITWHFVARFM